MELKLIREEKLKDRCLGKLYLNGRFFAYTCEDTDRGLTSEMSLDEIKDIKIAKNTCIPTGKYRIILSYSVKLKRYLPLILDVRGYRGIRIHKGSGPDFSSGCPLVGLDRKDIKLLKIKEAENNLIKILDSTNRTEAHYITIERDYE